MARPVVYIPERIDPIGVELLKAECDCLMPWQEGADLTADPPRELLYEADAVIVRLFQLGEDDFARSPKLKAVAKFGVGVDNIDFAAATTRGIPVLWCPGASSNAVAEHAIGLMFALSRQTVAADQMVRAGHFAQRDQLPGVELAGKTLGIIGLGRIGSRVANKAALGLGMRVLAYDPPLDKTNYQGPAAFVETLNELLSQSDFVSLHVPLTTETRGMINAATLLQMRPTARLINTARGAVVDETALAKALSAGQIAGAAIDAFEFEPLPADHPLCLAPHSLLTPHISASTAESWQNVARMAAEGVLAVLAGKQPEQVYNPEVFAQTAIQPRL